MDGINYEKITQNGNELDFTTFNDTIMFRAIPNGKNIVLEAAVPVGITESGLNSSEPTVLVYQNTIQVISSEIIRAIEIYSVSGALIKSIRPAGQTSYQISTNNLMQGAYIVRVATETSQKNVKVIVR